MIIKLATYSVKPGSVEIAKSAASEFVKSIKENEPGTFYESFIYVENTFVHLMKFKNEETEEYHRTSNHTKKFVEVIYPECIDPPVFKDLEIVE